MVFGSGCLLSVPVGASTLGLAPGCEVYPGDVFYLHSRCISYISRDMPMLCIYDIMHNMQPQLQLLQIYN